MQRDSAPFAMLPLCRDVRVKKAGCYIAEIRPSCQMQNQAGSLFRKRDKTRCASFISLSRRSPHTNTSHSAAAHCSRKSESEIVYIVVCDCNSAITDDHLIIQLNRLIAFFLQIHSVFNLLSVEQIYTGIQHNLS